MIHARRAAIAVQATAVAARTQAVAADAGQAPSASAHPCDDPHSHAAPAIAKHVAPRSMDFTGIANRLHYVSRRFSGANKDGTYTLGAGRIAPCAGVLRGRRVFASARCRGLLSSKPESGKPLTHLPHVASPTGFVRDAPNVADARDFIPRLSPGSAAAAFFDPQYRAVMDKMDYGNEGARQMARCALPQMSAGFIAECLSGLARALRPSGHAFVWTDKLELAEGHVAAFCKAAGLECVDLICWDKERFGMGYRSRRACEYLVVAQRPPRKVKGVWFDHAIPDVWRERAARGPAHHPHVKPLQFQSRLLRAVTSPGDLVVDPCAGGYSVLEAVAALPGVTFLGCDLRDPGPIRRADLAALIACRPQPFQ